MNAKGQVSGIINCLDMEDLPKSRPSDDQVWGYIKTATGVTNSSAFQQLKDGVRNEILKKLKGIGASHRQLERLTGTFRLRYEQRMLACYAMP